MGTRSHQYLLFAASLLIFMALSACSPFVAGSTSGDTQDRGNGTPAVLATDTRPVSPATTTTVGATSAFVRDEQLWITHNGLTPVQVTHFDYGSGLDIFWDQPAWSPGDHFIAFVLNARPAGLGGGGCPGPDYGANGALYVLDAITGKLTQLIVPTDSSDPLASSPYSGYWQYVFWEDPAHLLAWYNGITGKTSNSAGLYRYDLLTQTLTLVIPLNTLGIATLYSAEVGPPIVLSMRYSREQLFYQVVVHPFGQSSQFVIYRHSVARPELPSQQVADMGNGPWCGAQQSGPFIKPGWDVAPDGEHLAMQVVKVDTPAQGTSMIESLDLNNGSTGVLFTPASLPLLNQDLALAWGPDSRSIVATANRPGSQQGLYSASVANSPVITAYKPGMMGPVAWRPDSKAFALQSSGTIDSLTSSDVFMFVMGDAQGRLLLQDARDFVWG